MNFYKLVIEVCHYWFYEQKMANICSHRMKSLFFENFLSQHPFRSDGTYLITSTINVNILYGAWKTFSWGSSVSVIGEKWAKSFFHSKNSLVSKNLGFQQPIECKRNTPTTSTKIIKVTSGAWLIVPWVLSYSGNTREKGQKLFSTGVQVFSEMFVSNVLSGPLELNF